MTTIKKIGENTANKFDLLKAVKEEALISCVKPQASTQSEVLEKLINEIKPVNFREVLEIEEGTDIRQKHIIVGVSKVVLDTAKLKNWNLRQRHGIVYIFNGAYWIPLIKEDVKSFLGRCAIQMGCPYYEAAHHEFKDKLLKQFITEAHLPEPPKKKKTILVNLQNGTAEVSETGCLLRDFDPEDFLTYQLQFNYDQSAQSTIFQKFLDRVLPDITAQQVLQEFIGYIFSDSNLEKMLMLTGSGANGKSVVFNIVCALLGKEYVLNYSIGLFAHEYNRAKLIDILLNYSSEKGTDLAPDTFKALVSGEPLQARLPYGEPFTLKNKVKFIVNANELPKETEHTEAYFRRWLIIPFDVTIPEAERDTELASKIIEKELPGIFNWLLIGLHRISKNKKFTNCESSDKALSNFRKQSDSVALFIEEHGFKPSQTLKEALTDLYSKYKSFCLEDGYRPVGKNKFSLRLENKGFEKTRITGGFTGFFIEK